jgi:hypothetical protein
MTTPINYLVAISLILPFERELFGVARTRFEYLRVRWSN